MAHHPWILTFGILGNIISFMVYLAPLPTFFRVHRKKSTEGFQSIPYVIALFSAMLWIYYATLKSNAYLLITINAFGCIVETIYIIVFIVYAQKKARILTLKLLLLLNFGGFLLILLLTHFFTKGSSRIHIVGWSCVALSASVFAAPLSIMRLVIRTKSVEFMPFTLSFFLTLSAIMWLFYGILLKDIYVALPNILGVILGVIQMILYVIFKNCKNVTHEQKQPEKFASMVNQNPTKTFDAISSPPICDDKKVGKDQNVHDQIEPNETSMEASNSVQLMRDCVAV